jgi:hypothetical protein
MTGVGIFNLVVLLLSIAVAAVLLVMLERS